MQARCPTFKCQSRQIKDITTSHKGPTYSNFEDCFEDEGEKNRRAMDLQGRPIRQQLYKYYKEMEDNANTTRSN